MPQVIYDHIKAGDTQRAQAIEKVIRMFPIMEALDIRTVCFNLMAHVGWCRTKFAIPDFDDSLERVRETTFQHTIDGTDTGAYWCSTDHGPAVYRYRHMATGRSLYTI